MNYVGVDPGQSGGLAILFQGKEEVDCEAVPMLPTEYDIWEWFDEMRSYRSTFAVIEKVGGFVKDNPTPGSAMFKFGMNYGFLRGCLIAAGVPFEEVTPQTWQRGLSIPPRKKTESKTQYKNRLKARAQQLFPQVKITLKTCDALLIAEYCRRKHEGIL